MSSKKSGAKHPAFFIFKFCYNNKDEKTNTKIQLNIFNAFVFFFRVAVG